MTLIYDKAIRGGLVISSLPSSLLLSASLTNQRPGEQGFSRTLHSCGRGRGAPTLLVGKVRSTGWKTAEHHDL